MPANSNWATYSSNHKMFPWITWCQTMRQLGINLIGNVKIIYIENYKILFKKNIHEDQKEWKYI